MEGGVSELSIEKGMEVEVGSGCDSDRSCMSFVGGDGVSLATSIVCCLV